MSQHTHTMRLASDIPLGLPDRAGRWEKVVVFACMCGYWSTITGEFAVRSRHTHAALITRSAQEQREGSVYAHIAQQNETLLKRQRKLGQQLLRRH